jgi:hypothetical protein
MQLHDLHELDDTSETSPRPAAAAEQGVATVTAVHQSGGWWLRSAGRELRAELASSCLMQPKLGDQVWFAGDAEHGLFVLAVLVSATPGTTRIEAPGDLELRARGRVQIEGETQLVLQTDEIQVQAREATLSFVELRAVARTVFASLARVTRVGKLLELVVDTIVQRSNNSYRAIEGVDHHSAELIVQQASKDVHVDAQRALINGKDLVKMDGAQIHLG